MKKNYLFTLLLFFAVLINAQITIQGVPREDLKGKMSQQSVSKISNNFSLDDIDFWVGKGSKKAALVVQWNDSKNPDALVWGFRWDGQANGTDMLKAIAKFDKRFYTLIFGGTAYGDTIGGLGFDLDGKGDKGLYKNNNSSNPHFPNNGVVNTTSYDFDSYKAIDVKDHWQSGWNNGYWSYNTREASDVSFSYASVGASSRILEDGSWDLWNYSPGFSNVPIAANFHAVPVDYTQGYFMINEDWFGHRNGSLNFITSNDDVVYRPYATVNNNAAFGATAQFGTIYGDNMYVVSKQAADNDATYTAGGRLVVLDAVTLQKKAGFDTIGGGDGRSFLGVNEHTGYIGTSKGIYLFDIANLQVGTLIPSTDGTGQIGNMIRTSQYVFALKQNVGILVINPKNNTVINTIAGAYNGIVLAKNGTVWAITSTTLNQINTSDFATTSYALPTGKKYDGTWGAWNAGSFNASVKDNKLYYLPINGWSTSTTLVQFDVDSKSFNSSFLIVQPMDSQESIYGAGLGINPATNDFIINTTKSYSSDQIYRHNSAGILQSSIKLNENYFFQAMPVFPDNAMPVISNVLPSEVSLSNVTAIDLKDLVSDADNNSYAIVKSIKSNSNSSVATAEINSNDELILTPVGTGITTVVVSFNSNGKIVEKEITITTSTLSINDIKKVNLSIYPNPTVDILNIKTEDNVQNISIYDVSGKLIETKLNSRSVDVNSLSKGLYIIIINTDKAVYKEKFIKK